MRKLALVLFATLALLVGAGAANARSHGGGGHGGGFHGGDSHGGHFHHRHFHSVVFIGAPAFWWGAPYYPYDYLYPYYYDDYPYYWAPFDPGPTTYIQRDTATAAEGGGSQYSYYCTDPVGYYPQIQNCASGWLRVVPDGSPNPQPR